ncbi:MAG: ORF6N domain-containing protein [Bacteroidales bacterium]|nr:ORF6N domain-containing protein [Bacteroidales bacterium]
MNYLDIQTLIFDIRGKRIILDRDLAWLYGVETKRLNESVRRNYKRFEGDDFMFRLTKDETIGISSRSHFSTLNKGRGSNFKYLPFAFTELGVAMISSVLNSETAIRVNRDIMRAFVSLRQLTTQSLPDNNTQLREEIKAIRDEMNQILADQNDINESTRAQLDAISEALSELQSRSRETGRRQTIGFKQNNK